MAELFVTRIGTVTVEVFDEGRLSEKAFAHCDCGETLGGPSGRTLKVWTTEVLVPHAASHEGRPSRATK